MLTISRWASTPEGTVGRITYEDQLDYFTMEPRWKNNERFVSCIPDGIYELQSHLWKGATPTYALVNAERDVVYTGGEVARPDTRTLILFHPANKASELEGCIALGVGIQLMAGTLAVSSSRHAFRNLMDVIRDNSLREVEIRWEPQQVWSPRNG